MNVMIPYEPKERKRKRRSPNGSMKFLRGKIDEEREINWPVQLTERQWDLINIALIKVQSIKDIPESPFKDDWDKLYNLSKARGSTPTPGAKGYSSRIEVDERSE